MHASRALAVVAVLAVVSAGCLGGPGTGGGTGTPTAGGSTSPGEPGTTTAPTGGSTDDPTTTATTRPPDSTTERSGLGEDGYANAFTFRATPVSLGQVADDVLTPLGSLSDEGEAAAREALANGSATVTYLSHPEGMPDEPGPLADGERFQYDGAVYRVNATVADRVRGTGYGVDLEGPLRPEYHDDYETATEAAVAFDSLSPVQRDLFRYAAPGPDERESSVVHAGFYYLPPEDASLSATGWTDGDPHYVRHEGDVFRIQIEGDRPPVVRLRIRYTLDRVADDPESFVADRLPSLVTNVTSDTPAPPARSVILSAVENGTHEWEGTVETRPERVEAAAAWVRERSRAGSGAYVRYRGELYRITVRELIE